MNSLFKNSFFNFVSQIVSFLLNLIITILLARYLGPTLMGQYNFFLWLSASIALLFTLGLPKATTRFIASHSSKGEVGVVRQIISRSLLFEVKLSLLVSIVSIIVINTVLKVEDKFIFNLIAISLPLYIISYLLGSFIQGMQKFNVLLKINLLVAPITFVVNIILILLSVNLNILLIFNVFTSGFSVVLLLYSLRHYVVLKASKIPNNVFRNMLKYTLSASMIVWLDLVLMEKSEIFFLRLFSDFNQIAYYSISFGLVNRLMIFIPGAISGVLTPRFAQLESSKDSVGINSIYYYSSRYLILVTFPIIFGGLIITDLIVKSLYGNLYTPMIPIIRVLLVSGGLSAIVAAGSSYLYGVNKQVVILKIGLLCSVINILLDVILIPGNGAIGAAIANSVAQLLGIIIGIYYLTYLKKMLFPWNFGLKVLIACTIPSIFVLTLKQMIFLPDFTLMFIFGLLFISLYMLSLVFVKSFEIRDFEMFDRFYQKIPLPLVRNRLFIISNYFKGRIIRYERN